MCCNAMPCVALCCTVMQCIAVCCNVLQCGVNLFRFKSELRDSHSLFSLRVRKARELRSDTILQRFACLLTGDSKVLRLLARMLLGPACVLPCVAVCCSVLPCVAVCCSVLQCVAMCCSVLQCVTVLCCHCVCCSCIVVQSIEIC